MSKHGDYDAAMSLMQGVKLLEKLGMPKDQMIESATLDVIGSGVIKLNVVFIMSINQMKALGIDLDA